MKILRFTTTFALLLAIFVVMLGAYTRLTDAGLGCPDWPGCYGRMVLPSAQSDLAHAQATYPTVQLESRKAWTEMTHRYAAGTLVLLVISIVVQVWRERRRGQGISMLLPMILVFFIGFQAALGMWTVTLKLLPVVVMGHLLGGMFIVLCLSALWWQIRSQNKLSAMQSLGWQRWVVFGLILLILQIALGGWVSANYAGIACIGFPTCNGQWLPALHLKSAFHVAFSMGTNYQGGILEPASRVGIQMVHRIGAVVVLSYLVILMSVLLCVMQRMRVRIMSLTVLFLVLTQFGLGMANVIYMLPLPVAVLHNGVAVLLLVSLVSLYSLLSEKSRVA